MAFQLSANSMLSIDLTRSHEVTTLLVVLFHLNRLYHLGLVETGTESREMCRTTYNGCWIELTWLVPIFVFELWCLTKVLLLLFRCT